MANAVSPQRSCLNRLPSRATPYLAPAAGTIITATPLARASRQRRWLTLPAMSNAGPHAAIRERLPNRREHTVINFTTTDGFAYAGGVGFFEDGRLAEVFVNSGKIGTAIEMPPAIALLWPVLRFSMACQSTPFGTR